MTYILPLVLIVVSNIFYQICTKSAPEKMNPFASLTVTYIIGAAASVILYFATNRGGNLLDEYRHTNLMPILLGLVIVGLEAGYIYAYKSGWSVSMLPVVQSVIVAVALIFVGSLVYKEAITLSKVVGILVCMVGLYLMK